MFEVIMPDYKSRWVWIICALLLAGCQYYPKDPEDTLEKIKNATLMVGYSENPPWVIETSEEVSGIEADLVKEFAASHQAEIKWIKNTENELFQDLADRKIHLIIAGLTDDTPWKKEKIGITRPYFKASDKKHIMAIPQGENAFLISLEKFLLQKENEIKQMVKFHEKDGPV
jgi:polar amino acid transport system substrate-binding protein